jgi:phosphoglycolate phosphatase-like HAD superfamily hydrolase
MKLLIFDFDGPINDLIEAKRAAIQNLSKQCGITFSDTASWGLINYIDQIYETEGIYDYKKLVEKSLGKLKENKLLAVGEKQKEQFVSMFTEALDKYQIIKPSLSKIIGTVKQTYPHIKICIYTSQKEETVTKMLSDSKIERELFDKIYGREYFDEPKPSVVNLLKICKEFAVDPREVVSVGDNVSVDLAPASYLGMKTLLINKFVGMTVASIEDISSALQTID